MPELITLQTARLILRSPVAEDLDDMFTYIQHHDIAKNTLNMPYPYERHMADDWLLSVNERMEKKTGFHFAITLPENNRMMGSIGIYIDERHKRATVGYWLGKPFWNRGYVTEALVRVLQFGFEEQALKRIEATHFTYNPSSGRVMQKAGMQFEGILRHYVIKWDQPEDLAMYAMISDDWMKKP